MTLKRRALLRSGGSLVLLLGAQHIAHGASIVAVRVWPAADYTRVTIESDNALVTEQKVIENPPRLALDIQGLDLDPQLRELVGKIKPGDPYISGVRIGHLHHDEMVVDARAGNVYRWGRCRPVPVHFTHCARRAAHGPWRRAGARIGR